MIFGEHEAVIKAVNWTSKLSLGVTLIDNNSSFSLDLIQQNNEVSIRPFPIETFNT